MAAPGFTNHDNPIGVLLLCEVALGDMYERTSAEYRADLSCQRAGCQSTWGIGRTHPDPKATITTDDGVIIPTGKGCPNTKVANSSLLYSAFHTPATVHHSGRLTCVFVFVCVCVCVCVCVWVCGWVYGCVGVGMWVCGYVGVRSLVTDEYIVYDTAQIRMKYVLMVKFNHKFRRGW